MLTALLMCFVGSAQKKKMRKVILPPPVRQVEESPVEVEEPIIEDTEKKCFIYKTEIQKDAILYVTETLLEYGWSNNLAQMVITTYHFDPIKKEQTEKAGYLWGQAKNIRFINGTFRMEEDIFVFMPDKAEDFEKQLFKINFEIGKKEVSFLTNENNNILQKGDCFESIKGM